MRIGIVGGGIAGLVTAFELRRHLPDSEVQLFESASRLGGTVQTDAVDGYLLERGADMFACQPAAALQLCEHLGLTERLIRPQPEARGAAVVHRGSLIRVPAGFVLMRPTRVAPILTTPLLSLGGKIRLLQERWVPPLQGADDQSVADFVIRRLGHEAYQRLVQPLVGGIYTGNCEELSMAATMPQFWQMEQEDGSLAAATRRRRREGLDRTEQTSAGARYEQFRSLPGGTQELIDALIASLPTANVHTGCRISRVEPWSPTGPETAGNEPVGDGQETGSPSGWRIVIEGSRNDAAATAAVAAIERPFDQLVLATPAAIAGRLLTGAATMPAAGQAAERAATNRASSVGLIDDLSSIQAASSAIVALGVKSADLRRDVPIAGFVVPKIERRPILAASFTSDKFPGRAPQGERLIRVFFGGRLNPQVFDCDDADLIHLARKQLGELVGLVGTPLLAKVIRWDRAMPQYTVGHARRVQQIETALDGLPGLHLAGNSYSGVGLAPTIARSQTIAQKIAQQAAG